MKKLWEAKHPYRCNETTWTKNYHYRYDNTQDFLESLGNTDADLNYIVRWDWIRETDDNEQPISNNGTFYVYLVIQRKGYFQSGQFPVTEADEPILRSWLEERWKTIHDNWDPISCEAKE